MKREALRVGDKIKLLHVPRSDLDDRAKRGSEEGWVPTATVLEYLIEHQPVVEITEIDEYGKPWFGLDVTIEGDTSYHTIALFDDECWEFVK